MKHYMLYLFFFPSILLGTESSVAQISQQAQALEAAQDYTGASALYEQLLEKPLPSWQKSRLLYNLGTIRLAQHQPDEALNYFQDISPTDLSLPHFAGNLFLNEGIAYLQQVEQLVSQQSSFRLGQEAALIEQAQRALAEAERLICYPKKGEKEKGDPCVPLISQWQTRSRLAYESVIQQQRDIWLKTLDPKAFKDEFSIRQAILNYYLLTLNDPLKEVDIQTVMAQFPESSHSIQEILQSAIKAEGKIEKQFLLIAGLHNVDQLLPNETTPIAILQDALTQLGRTLQLFLLWEMFPQNEQKNGFAILLNQQKYLIKQVALFIPAVLKEQKIRYKQNETVATKCQQSPWNQVIPLFDQGYQGALQTTALLETPDFDHQTVKNKQNKILHDWQQALELLLHPPLSAEPQTSQQLTESLRLVQEMYLEDQSQTDQQETQELHTW